MRADACVVCKLAGIADGTGALDGACCGVRLFWLLQAVADTWVVTAAAASHAYYFWASNAALCGAAGPATTLLSLLGGSTTTRVPARRRSRCLLLKGLW
jgi:hypothetical protein